MHVQVRILYINDNRLKQRYRVWADQKQAEGRSIYRQTKLDKTKYKTRLKKQTKSALAEHQKKISCQ